MIQSFPKRIEGAEKSQPITEANPNRLGAHSSGTQSKSILIVRNNLGPALTASGCRKNPLDRYPGGGLEIAPLLGDDTSACESPTGFPILRSTSLMTASR